jgi:DNA-directed RNA polymerase specialized sigma24 family protein
MSGLTDGESARLGEYLNALPTRSRLLVLLHYVDGLTHTEIAGVLECTEEEVLNDLRDIVDQARTRLKAQASHSRPDAAAA